MAEAQSQNLAEVVLGNPETANIDASCRFEQVDAPVTAVIFGATGDLTARMLMKIFSSSRFKGRRPAWWA